MPAIFEKLAGGQPGFDTEAQQGAYVIEQTLGAREPTARLVRGRFMQYRANYSRPAANTTLSLDGGTYYFVDDVDFEDMRGGLQSWTRLWATVPATWLGPEEEYAFSYPAYSQPAAFGNIYPITGATANSSNYTLTTNANGVSPADTLFLDINYVRDSQNYHVTFATPALFASAGTNVTIRGILPGTGTFSGVTGSLRENNRGRGGPATIVVGSRLQYDYAVADDATIDTLLPLMEKFTPVTTAGNETTALTASTVPTATTYSSMINAGVYIVAEPSTRRRYLGNIFERVTRMVPAR